MGTNRTGAGLHGKRVLITRAGGQSEEFARALRECGAEPILAPTIAIRRLDDPAVDAELGGLPAYDWLIFTSQNGVEAFFARLCASGRDCSDLGSAKMAAIGEATAAAIRRHGAPVALVAADFVNEDLARAIAARARAGGRALLFRAREAREVLPQMLRDAGLAVTVVAAYETVTAADRDFAAKAARADILTFTSASTVKGFVELLGGRDSAQRATRGRFIACIGPIAAQAASDAGLHVDVTATVHTTAGMLDAMRAHYPAPA